MFASRSDKAGAMTQRSNRMASRLANRAGRALAGRARIPFARWLRGRKDMRRLRRADCVLVAFAKSGRTWLRVMISRLFQVKYGLPPDEIMELDNFHRSNPAIPAIFFTSGSYISEAHRLPPPRTPFDDKKVIFLARHPGDVAASYYFHVDNRVTPHLKDVKGLPADLSDTPIHEFIMSKDWGVPAIIAYLNRWAGNLVRMPESLLVRYEDLRADPAAELRRIAAFLGETFADDAYAEAVAFASFDRLRERERQNFFGNDRLAPRDAANPDSFKVRRGKVGGYRDYLTPEQAEAVDDLVRRTLSPIFGYDGDGGAPRAAASAWQGTRRGLA
jgi:hypothetical protein